jgi:DNA-directed RNA polymerase III subunit RPC1
MHALMSYWSAGHAAIVMNRVAKLSARWIGDRGFSIGIDDVTPSLGLANRKDELVVGTAIALVTVICVLCTLCMQTSRSLCKLHTRQSNGYTACDEQIRLYKAGKLEAQSGCDADQTLESILLGQVSCANDNDIALLYNALFSHVTDVLVLFLHD